MEEQPQLNKEMLLEYARLKIQEKQVSEKLKNCNLKLRK